MLTPSANATAFLTGRVARYFMQYFMFDPRVKGERTGFAVLRER
jgi:hypothetical protein